MKRFAGVLVIAFFVLISSKAQDFELIPYRVKDKWGFSDSLKNIRISPQYDDVTPFNLGYAAFKSNGKWGFLDISGKVTLVPTYDSVINYFDLISAYENGNTDEKTGIEVVLNGNKQFVDPKGATFEETVFGVFDEDFGSGNFVFEENNLYGLKDFRSKILVKAQYEALRIPPYAFSLYFFKRNNKWGCLNSKYEEFIANIYDSINYEYPGFMIVKRDGKFGVINYQNDIIAPTIYDNVIRTQTVYGFYIMNNKGKKGYINNEGKVIMPPNYDDIIKHGREQEAFSINIKGKWGYHDDENRIYIKPKYKEIQCFRNGYALVIDLNGNKGYINAKGREYFK